MRDYRFFNADLPARGFGRVINVFRRLLRRLLRPFFLRQAELLEELGTEVDHMKAFLCDTTAMARRLATLEDRVEELTRKVNGERSTQEPPLAA